MENDLVLLGCSWMFCHGGSSLFIHVRSTYDSTDVSKLGRELYLERDGRVHQ
jgi:hypothetical protein